MKNKYSDYKIVHFPEKIKSFVQGQLTSPLYVRIKPINLCNHGCFFCGYSTGFRVKDDPTNHIDSGMHQGMREDDVIPTDKMFEILDDLSEMGVKAVTYSGGGEPLMHQDIVKIMSRTLEKNIDLSIITNGQNLVKDRASVLADAKWVRVSMDYTDPAQMESFRNVPQKSFSSVIKNIENFSKIKNPDCDLSVNFIVHKNNYQNLYDFAALLKNSGVENVRFSPMWIPEFYEYHAPIADHVNNELDKISKLIDGNFSVNTTYNVAPGSSHSTIRSYSRCFVMETIPVIGADLGIYACHNKAYDDTGKIGSIKDMRFKDFWFSDQAKEFCQSFNPKLKCLHECSNDRKNILINHIFNSSDDNFV
jgi:MoaA/NifB/PqqE/SkfB family radical SAM enzyme